MSQSEEVVVVVVEERDLELDLVDVVSTVTLFVEVFALLDAVEVDIDRVCT
jgi:hypothetical protein